MDQYSTIKFRHSDKSSPPRPPMPHSNLPNDPVGRKVGIITIKNHWSMSTT